MNAVSIGDMARAFQLRLLSTGLKTDLDRLGRELSTGRKADTATGAARDFAPIAAIERSLATLAGYQTAAAEAAVTVEAAQASLGVMQDIARNLNPTLVQVSTSHSAVMTRTIAVDVRAKFGSVIGALNAGAAGRTALAGAATDGPALAGTDEMLSLIGAAASGETTASGVMAVIDAWFDTPGGGFETAGYLGSDTPLGPLPVGEGETMDMPARADDPAIRAMLKAFAAGALVAEGVLAGDSTEQTRLIETAGLRMIEADGGLTVKRAEIGAAEARIETAKARNQAEITALDIARAELVAADPYETASELEAVYGQLETLYTLTARLSRLSFTDYMK